MFKLVVEADSLSGLLEAAEYRVNQLKCGIPATPPAPAQNPPQAQQQQPSQPAAPAAEPKRRGRPAKAVETPPAATPAPAAPAAPASGAKTVDDVRAAMMRVTEKHAGDKGLSLVTEIVQKYGKATRISDVKPEDYAAVIEACDKAVA